MFVNVPWVPFGTTLSSFAILVNRLNCDSSQTHTMMTLFGTRSVRPESSLGIGVAICARQIASGSFSDVDTILHSHTLWPLYAYPLPRSVRQEWRNALANVGSSGRWNAFLSGHHGTPIAKKNMHLCLQCVEDDLAAIGVAHWRTFHQIPGINHCIVHRDDLIGVCQSCARRLGTSWKTRLPLPYCSQCAKPFKAKRARASVGYWSLLNFIARVFSGHWSILTPESRERVYENYLEGRAISKQRLEALLGSIIRSWELDGIEALSVLLKTRLSAQVIARAIEGRSYEAPPLLHLLLLSQIAICEQRGEIFVENTLCDSNAPALKRNEPESIKRPDFCPYRLPPDKEDELKRALSRKGYPVSMLYELYVGNGWRQVRTDYGVLEEPRGKVGELVPWFDAYTKMLTFDKSAKWMDRRQPRKDVEIARQWYRDVLMQAIENDDRVFFLDQWKRAMPQHLEWMFEHDRQWLMAILPMRFHSRYRLHGLLASRAAICEALCSHDPDALGGNVAIALNWARDNDRLWLDTIVRYTPCAASIRNKLLPIERHLTRTIQYYRWLLTRSCD